MKLKSKHINILTIVIPILILVLMLIYGIGNTIIRNNNYDKLLNEQNLTIKGLENQIRKKEIDRSSEKKTILNHVVPFDYDRLDKDKEVSREIFETIFNFTSYSEWEDNKAKLINDYKLDPESKFLHSFYYMGETDDLVEADGTTKRINQLDTHGIVFYYRDMGIPRLYNVDGDNYEYIVDVTYNVGKARTKGTDIEMQFIYTLNGAGELVEIYPIYE